MSADALITEARALCERIAPAYVRIVWTEDGAIVVYARTAPDDVEPVIIYHGADPVAAQAAIRNTYPMTEAA